MTESSKMTQKWPKVSKNTVFILYLTKQKSQIVFEKTKNPPPQKKGPRDFFFLLNFLTGKLERNVWKFSSEPYKPRFLH